MPKKSIVLSNQNGRIRTSRSASFSYDTDTKYISISDLSASTISINGAYNSIFTVVSGVITPINAADNNSKYIVSDGTKWIADFPSNAAVGIAEGDLTGSYPNPKFKNISNISTGSLRIARGGLSGSGLANILSTIPSGSLLIANGTASISYISTASISDYTKDYVLGTAGNLNWSVITASAAERDVDVQYFTCSNPLTTSIQTWTKNNSNHRWARVMIQAGGGCGTYAPSTVPAGGGAGGFTDTVIYVGNINTATITVGQGATGSISGVGAGTAHSSSFSASNTFLSALPGGNGTAATPGTGGLGLTFTGGIGGGNTNDLPPNALGSAGGAYGIVTTNVIGGTAGAFSTNTTASITNANGLYKSNLYGYNVPIGFGSGGSFSGSTTAANSIAGNGIFGSGGAGARGAGAGGRTGNGGSGFVVIVSY